MKTKSVNPRSIVIEILLASFPSKQTNGHDGQSLASAITKKIGALESTDQPLVKNICYGVYRHYYFLDALLQIELSKPLRNKDQDIYIILLAASYELLFLNTPQHVVISQFVEVCQTRNKIWAKGLVNAILRKLQRKGLDANALKQALLDDVKSNKEKLSFDHPQWMIDKLRADWPDYFENILLENNKRAPMTLRVNKNHVDRKGYIDLLAEQSINSSQATAESSPECIYLTQPIDVNILPRFSDGWVSVQDEAAQQAAPLLKLKPNLRVLDACSAPGGKAGHLLELENSIELVCLDNQAQRLTRVKQNFKRLNFSSNSDTGSRSVTCLHADAGDTDVWWDGVSFDRILLDAPCSASGIIRRNPDVKLQRQAKDISRLAQIQLELLSKLWPCLAKDGLLLYATCSVFKEENQHIIKTFLEQEQTAVLEKMSLPLGQQLEYGQQLFPQENGHDGFYYALLRKV